MKGLSVDVESLFPPASGFFERRRNAARAELLSSLAELLRTTLAPAERVRFLARACRHGVGAGSSAAPRGHAERCSIVVTDRRLLLLQIDRHGQPGARREHARLEEIRGTRAPALRVWRIELGDGRKLRFALARADRRRLDELLFARPGPKSPCSLEPLPAPWELGRRREVA
jgi:hypothetical protein